MNKMWFFPCVATLTRSMVSAAIGACVCTAAHAMPSGPTVMAGEATFSTQGSVLTVVSSPGAVIHWQGFSIAAGEVVRFVGATPASSVVNHVVGDAPVMISGMLQSNGEIALVSANGVVLGPTGTVDAAALSITGSQVNLGGNVSLAANAPVQVTAPILTNQTAGTITVSQTMAPVPGPITPMPVTLTPGNVAFAPRLEMGWNLIGNSLSGPIDVAAMFGVHGAPIAGVSENVLSVWKWHSGTSQWSFFSPQQSPEENAEFARINGFAMLETVQPREGFWVSVQTPFALPPQVGSTVDLGAPEFSALPPGFSLVAIGHRRTPAEFNDAVGAPGGGGPMGQMHANFRSLWAWDETQQKWLFHSPMLQAMGGMTAVRDYAGPRGFLHFPDRNRMLDIGVGFWIDK